MGGLPLADLAYRIVAGIIDSIILLVFEIVLAVVVAAAGVTMIPLWSPWETSYQGSSMIGLGFVGVWLVSALVLLAIDLVYFPLFEATSGQTPGKKIMKVKVVKENGAPCDWGAALIRNFLRIFDVLPVAYLLGVLLIATNAKRQRIGDMVAKTLVIKA